METQTDSSVTVPAVIADDPLLAEAYRAAAQRNVLRALNPAVFFGYFSEKTGDLGQYPFPYYCEYPANFIRIVHRFLEPE